MNGDKEKNFVSAVIYIHNNEGAILAFLAGICRVMQANFEKYEIICVDDASTDQSVAKVRDFSSQSDTAMISIIKMSYYQGLEHSMNAGMDLAIGDFVFEFDRIQLDFDFQLIMQIYRHSLTGFDIVNAAPKNGAGFVSKMFYVLYNRYSKQAYKLQTESFRVLSRRGINRVHSLSKTIPYRKAIYANCGLKMDTVYYEPLSKQDRNISENRWNTAINSLILFTDVAYRFASLLAIGMMVITACIGIYALLIYFDRQPVVGWTSMMLLLSGGFFGIFAIAAIVIKYLSILIDLEFRKKNYLIEDIEKLSK